MMKSTADSSTNTILSIFPNAIRLIQYFGAIDHLIIKKNDPSTYIDFINNTFIIPPQNNSAINIDFKDIQQTYPIRDIINRIVGNIIRSSNINNSNYREQNVLTLGYRMRSSMGENSRMRGQLDLECYFVNTIQTLVTTKSWQLLADRIGLVEINIIVLLSHFKSVIRRNNDEDYA